MLSKCANPACFIPFRRLREGKLFRVETESTETGSTPHARRRSRSARRVEHYWLCEQCAPYLTLSPDSRGIAIISLPQRRENRFVSVVQPDPQVPRWESKRELELVER